MGAFTEAMKAKGYALICVWEEQANGIGERVPTGLLRHNKDIITPIGCAAVAAGVAADAVLYEPAG